MLDTSVRLLRLLSLLQVRREWSGAELAGRLDVTTRTVRNDIERLRILGYQVNSTTGVAGGYRLGVGSSLPPLLLDDDEAVAVGLGLRAAASGTVTGIEETSLRALTKLEQTLPARLRHRLDALAQITLAPMSTGSTVDAETLTVIAAACRDHQVLRFDYRGAGGGASTRRLEPHRLTFTGRRWYLLGFDLDRSDWRTFRVDRVTPRTPTGPRFTPREAPEDSWRPEDRNTARRPWTYRARVRLDVQAERVGNRVTAAGGRLEPLDDHSCVLAIGTDSLQWLIGYLTTLDVGFEILDPPELRAALLALAERYRAAAGAPAVG